MRIVVTGSRDWNDQGLLESILDRYPLGGLEIHVGDANGADLMARHWALKTLGMPAEVYAAEWFTHGKSAGPIRNRQMLDTAKPDLLIAFKRGDVSRGTDDCISAARQRGIPVLLIQRDA